MNVAINVGQLTQPVPGGIGRYVSALVDGLPAVGVDVTRFGPTRAHALVYERWHRVRTFAAAGLRGADVVHAPSLAVPATGERPLVVTVHDLVFRRFPQTLTPRGVRFHERGFALALRYARAIVVPSEFVASELVEDGVDAGRIHVIHHGIAVPHPPAAPRTGNWPPTVFAVGTLEPRKGHDTLFAATPIIRRAVPDVSVVVAGARGWGAVPVPSDVRHIASATDAEIDVLYRDADVVVVPSRYEGFGFPVLEAMARGIPVVATKAAALPEVAGDAAILVTSDDPRALAAAITAVLTQDDVAADLRARGLARAAEFTWDRSLRLHREVYDAHS